MTQITITLNKIIDHDPCSDGWENILRGRGKAAADDEEFPLSEAFESNSLEDVIWALRCLPEHDRLWRKFAVWCARQVQHLMTDERSINALDVAWRHSNGEATDEELQAARAAATAARDDAWAAVWAAWAAWDAAMAARDAASADASDAALDAASAAQKAKLIQILDAGEWVE